MKLISKNYPPKDRLYESYERHIPIEEKGNKEQKKTFSFYSSRVYYGWQLLFVVAAAVFNFS